MATEKATTTAKTAKMNIALSPEDKLFLKVYAAQRDIPVADVLHEWIEQARQQQKVAAQEA